MGIQDRDYYKEKIEEIERGGKIKQKISPLFTILIIIVILGLVLSSFIFSFR